MAGKKTIKQIIREWFDAFLWAFVLAVIVRTLLFEPYMIPTSSMVPTFLPKDKIFVSKIHYGPRIPFIGFRLWGFTTPKRGDIVVFIAPPDPQKSYVKRLIGLPGDKVRIANGNIYLNGEPVSDPRISKRFYYNFGEYGQEKKELVVPADSFFVLGDNSASSRDSRYWGFVPKKNIIGKALCIWWPFSRIKIVE